MLLDECARCSTVGVESRVYLRQRCGGRSGVVVPEQACSPGDRSARARVFDHDGAPRRHVAQRAVWAYPRSLQPDIARFRTAELATRCLYVRAIELRGRADRRSLTNLPAVLSQKTRVLEL